MTPEYSFAKHLFSSLAIGTILLGGCAVDVPFMGDELEMQAADLDAIASAVADPRRPSLDTDRDATRQPDGVLEFFGLSKGETVIDMFAGGGYYSEILSRTVGAEGRVIAHNNAGYRKFIGNKDAPRYANNRLPNVIRLEAEADALELEPESVDTAILALSYHDVYFSPANSADWPAINGPVMLQQLFAGMKAGGVLGIIDHAGRTGMTEREISELHRIDQERVVRELEGAGFVFDRGSKILRNPDDDMSVSVFDPEIRGRSDRFVLRFLKPMAEKTE